MLKKRGIAILLGQKVVVRTDRPGSNPSIVILEVTCQTDDVLTLCKEAEREAYRNSLLVPGMPLTAEKSLKVLLCEQRQTEGTKDLGFEYLGFEYPIATRIL